MELLDNLLNTIINFHLFKWSSPEKRIKRIDVVDYALCLVDYIIDSIDKIDDEFLFMSKFAIDYLIYHPLICYGGETKTEKEQYEKKMQELGEKTDKIDYACRLKSFDEFISNLYFPRIVTEKDASDVISKNEFYDNSDDLYRTMRLGVVYPNDRLLRHYSKYYKGVKMEYIKMIAEVVKREVSRIDFELNESDKQFVQLCNMINRYLKPSEGTYYDVAEQYLSTSMNIMLQKIKGKNK